MQMDSTPMNRFATPEDVANTVFAVATYLTFITNSYSFTFANGAENMSMSARNCSQRDFSIRYFRFDFSQQKNTSHV